MIICGQKFEFSALNANDLDRMDAAQQHMQAASDRESKRAHTGTADILRGQCRLMMGLLRRVAGRGRIRTSGPGRKQLRRMRNNSNLEKTMYKLHKKYRQKTNEKRTPDLTNGLWTGKIRPAQRSQRTLQRLKFIWMK